MIWTTQVPTKLGWYWFRFGPIDEPVMFCISASHIREASFGR